MMRRRPGSRLRHAQIKIQSRSETHATRPQAGQHTKRILTCLAWGLTQTGKGNVVTANFLMADCRAKRRHGVKSGGLKRRKNTASRRENAASETPETFSFIYGGEDYKAPPLLAAGCSTRGNVLHNPPSPTLTTPVPFCSFSSIAIRRF